jgi:adenylosuccinate synthase
MNLVVIGAQWGDEGKGKIVDFLADRADTVVRFSGGANAGHTIVRGETKYKLHLVPSGIVYDKSHVVLGSGMVIDPKALFDELDELTRQGVQWDGRVFISDRAHLVLPRYREEDEELEKARENPIGTTGRGIGVAYATKAARHGIRVADMMDDAVFAELREEDREFLSAYRDRLRPMVCDIQSFIEESAGEQVLFEGAQGTLLDLDVGTYPYVSSGHSCAGGAAIGAGVGPAALDRVLGVFKAYTTRVGNGPFPTEFVTERDGDLADTIRELGNEYGVTTGRARRCGYLDLVALRYACRINSIDTLALTHLDIYDGMDDIKACVSYQIGDEIVERFPASRTELENAVPVTKRFPGWKQPLGEIRNYERLPEEAKDYIAFIENYTGASVDVVSVGSDHKHTIVRRDPWTQS